MYYKYTQGIIWIKGYFHRLKAERTRGGGGGGGGRSEEREGQASLCFTTLNVQPL